MHTFLHKTIFITGGGSWIGKAMALQFSHHGANIFIIGRNEEKLKTTCDEIINQGGKAHYAIADVTDENSLKTAIQTAVDTWGQLDIVIPNAAIYPTSPITELSLTEWNEVLNTNLTSAFLTVKHTTPHLRKQQQGRIIFISSVAGEPIGLQRGLSHYCASKAGMNGFMRAAALELAADNITVNCISPGNICHVERFGIDKKTLTEMVEKIPLGRIGKPADIANTALFLASEGASFITGQTFIVDGGQCIKE